MASFRVMTETGKKIKQHAEDARRLLALVEPGPLRDAVLKLSNAIDLLVQDRPGPR